MTASRAVLDSRAMKAGLLIAAGLLCTVMCTGAWARHRSHSSGTPGEFDYYLLSLSWSPAYCLDAPGAAECNGPRRYGFIVHGLWPQYERGAPEHCNVHREVPEDVVRGVADFMPARNLVYHEWSAHGTCSGLEPADYFSLVRRAYASVVMPPQLTAPGAPVQMPTTAIAESFLRSNPRLPAQAMLVTCSSQGAPRLREVRVCFDRALAPRPCSADVVRGACRAPELIVPPIR